MIDMPIQDMCLFAWTAARKRESLGGADDQEGDRSEEERGFHNRPQVVNGGDRSPHRCRELGGVRSRVCVHERGLGRACVVGDGKGACVCGWGAGDGGREGTSMTLSFQMV